MKGAEDNAMRSLGVQRTLQWGGGDVKGAEDTTVFF